MTRSTLPEGRRRVALESIGIIPVNVAGAGAGLASLASGIGRLADGVAEADGVRQREQAAQQADSSVTRDAEGNIAIADNPFSDPRARSIFQGQQRQRYLAEIGTDAKRAATDLHVANPLDPAAFDAAWQGRTEGTLAQVPPAFREDARRKTPRRWPPSRSMRNSKRPAGIICRWRRRASTTTRSSWRASPASTTFSCGAWTTSF
jgi:X-X-X-Leu-X-X-Gly heptad repeat protein